MNIFHASALPRIIPCPGSVGLAKQQRKPADTDINEEGTAAHWLAEQFFKGQRAQLAPGVKAPNGWVCDPEMFEHVGAYHDKFNNSGLLNRVEMPAHWDGPKGDGAPFQVRLRADLIIWNAAQETLAITDFKYGFRYVSAENNWQLLSCAVGAAIGLGVAPKKFILAIYQPRGPGEALRWVELTNEEVFAAYNTICRTLGYLTDNLQTGPHCRYCPAAVGCPAVQRAAYNAVDVAMNSSALALTPEGFRSELDVLDRAAEMVKQRIKWIESAALLELKDGKPVPGLATKQRLGKTDWKPDTLTKLKALQTDNQRFFDEEPVTPAEAKRRGMSDEDYAALTHRPVIGVNLVRGDATEQAAKVFGEKK